MNEILNQPDDLKDQKQASKTTDQPVMTQADSNFRPNDSDGNSNLGDSNEFNTSTSRQGAFRDDPHNSHRQLDNIL